MSETNATGTSVAIITSSLPTIIAADKEGILHAFAREFMNFKPDASSEAGRKLIGQMKRKAGVAKMDLIRLGKTLREDADKVVKGIVAESKVITERFDEIIEQIEAPLVAYKKQEEDRVNAHLDALNRIVESSEWGPTEASVEIESRLNWLRSYPARDWQEFAGRAEETLAHQIDRAERFLAAALKREDDASLLAKLQAEQAERDRLWEIERQFEREKEIAARARAEAEEAARREIEAAAERERQAEARAAAAAEVERQRAAREEERRIAEHNDILGRMRKLAEPLTSVDPVIVIDMKIDQLQGFAEREWEEFSAQAVGLFTDCMSMLQAARVKSVAAAEAQAEEAKAKAEAAAVEAERHRVEAEATNQRIADEQRAANKAHQSKINREVLEDMIAVIKTIPETEIEESDDFGALIAKAITVAIAKKQVRHAGIKY